FINLTKIVYKVTLIFSEFLSGGGLCIFFQSLQPMPSHLDIDFQQ
ncbi:MAG: hypothetical protein ACJA0H_002084, partial [Francisellaceae bacterium]